MYQTIDDNESEGLETRGSRTGAWPFIIGIVALLAILTLVYLNSPGPSISPTPDKIDQTTTESYRKAISEPNPALRRARLNDYLLTIENAPHAKAVIAQLDILNRYELEDWENLQNTAYNLRSSSEDKMQALEDYETKWGIELLGARDEEFNRLKENILNKDVKETLPDRRFKGGPSPIPENVPDNELAGGPRPTITFVPPNRPVSPPASRELIVETTPLRVKRNITPRYPRKALRRNVEAVVTLKLNIDERGRVAMTELVNVEAERYARDFVKAAERAALRTRYHPRTENGRPVAVSGVTKRYKFEAN